MNTVTDGLLELDLGLTWRNRFAQLGPAFSTALPSQPLPDPYWVGRSPSVAREVGLDPRWLDSPELLQALSGNLPLKGSQPLASVYSGHQFGVWAGQLGDGRALLLGETANGLEWQLKGAGRTPYSRGGDGRAVLRSSIREFLCSEAMHALGIPTTRALSVTGSDAPIRREEIETAAIVTRVAPSFIRFGHFEHFSYLDQIGELRTLADFVIDHFYPQCRRSQTFEGNPYAALLNVVSERTAALLAQWQSVGFCHGVMNTDNMSILGLTIDYGPFQFLDAYVPDHICNHSDTQGRYAFNQQPNIAYWNLFCLGQALLPLIEKQELAIAALESFKTVYPNELEKRMGSKLGLLQSDAGDRLLVSNLLKLMAQDHVDYTIFWRRLSHFVADGQVEPVSDLFMDRAAAQSWLGQYTERLGSQDRTLTSQGMLQVNPKFILRNHLGEQAIQLAKLKDFSAVQTLLTLLEKPFEEHPAFEAYAGFPPDWASTIEISCSS
jgi:uncharacterized protein YdiU (UPF0061 family)